MGVILFFLFFFFFLVVGISLKWLRGIFLFSPYVFFFIIFFLARPCIGESDYELVIRPWICVRGGRSWHEGRSVLEWVGLMERVEWVWLRRV